MDNKNVISSILLQINKSDKLRLAIMTCITALLYHESLFGEFVWDDRTYFIDNDILPSLRPWQLKNIILYPSNYWNEHYPLRDLLFVLQYNIFGHSTLGYHVVSIFLFISIGLLLYKTLTLLFLHPSITLLNSAIPSDKVRPLAFFITSFFLIHPVHVESVAYISGQKDLLYALFSISALYTALSLSSKHASPSWKQLIPFCFLYYCSFLSKNAAVGTMIFLSFCWLFFNEKNIKIGKAVFYWSLINVPVIFWLSYSKRIGITYLQGVQEIAWIPLWERLIRTIKIIGAHSLIAFKPYPLNFGYPFDSSLSFDTNLFIGMSVLILSIVLVLKIRRSIITIGLFIYLAFLFPSLQIFFSFGNATIYDRYLFMPIIGIGMLVGGVLTEILLRWSTIKSAVKIITALGITVLFILTYTYIPKFYSDIESTRHAYSTYPEWPSSAFNYTYSLIEGNKLEEAMNIVTHEKTLKEPLWVRSYFIGWMCLRKGDLRNAVKILELSSFANERGGFYPYPNIPLAKAYYELNNYDKAKTVIMPVLRSRIHNPVEFYHAKILLDKINRHQSSHK